VRFDGGFPAVRVALNCERSIRCALLSVMVAPAGAWIGRAHRLKHARPSCVDRCNIQILQKTTEDHM